ELAACPPPEGVDGQQRDRADRDPSPADAGTKQPGQQRQPGQNAQSSRDASLQLHDRLSLIAILLAHLLESRQNPALVARVHCAGRGWVRRVSEALANLTPYQRFSLLVAATFVLGTVVLSLTIATIIERYVADDTATQTAREIDEHYRLIFDDSIF